MVEPRTISHDVQEVDAAVSNARPTSPLSVWMGHGRDPWVACARGHRLPLIQTPGDPRVKSVARQKRGLTRVLGSHDRGVSKEAEYLKMILTKRCRDGVPLM
jgi:hypothetical protein